MSVSMSACVHTHIFIHIFFYLWNLVLCKCMVQLSCEASELCVIYQINDLQWFNLELSFLKCYSGTGTTKFCAAVFDLVVIPTSHCDVMVPYSCCFFFPSALSAPLSPHR